MSYTLHICLFNVFFKGNDISTRIFYVKIWHFRYSSTCPKCFHHLSPSSSWFFQLQLVLSPLWFCRASPVQPCLEVAATSAANQAPLHHSAELEECTKCSFQPEEDQWWKPYKGAWALEATGIFVDLWQTSGRPPEMKVCTACPESWITVEEMFLTQSQLSFSGE